MNPVARLALWVALAASLVFVVQRAVSYGLLLRSQAKQALGLSAQARQVADSLRAEVLWREAQLEAAVSEAKQRDTVIVIRERRIRDSLPVESYPDTCQKPIAERDTLIADLRFSRDSWRASFELEQRNTADLRMALDSVQAASDSLAGVVRATMPSGFWSHLMPKLGGGVFGGICTDGTACAGVGVTLSWEF